MLQSRYSRSVSIATEKFSNGFTRRDTLLRVALAAVDVEDVAVVLSALPEAVAFVAAAAATAAAAALFVEILELFGSLLAPPPDMPAIRDPSLAVPSANGNFPPRGDRRLVLAHEPVVFWRVLRRLNKGKGG